MDTTDSLPPLKYCSRLCDWMCRQLFLKSGDFSSAKGKFPKQLQFLRSDKFFNQVEELITLIDKEWLSNFDSFYPAITQNNRRLAMLLYMDFSIEAISFLTNRKDPGAVYTAKSRLKRILLQKNCPEVYIILKELGMDN